LKPSRSLTSIVAKFTSVRFIAVVVPCDYQNRIGITFERGSVCAGSVGAHSYNAQ